MASLYGTSAVSDVTTPPIVAELQGIFARLTDAPLLAALHGPVRRGPKGYPVAVLWRCYLTRYILGLSSTAALIRELRRNPFIARACGIDSPDAIPHEATFSRFMARLSRPRAVPLLKDVSRALVRECYATIPAFGRRVAMDSTTVKAWANGARGKKTDPDAGWSIKKGTQGKKEFTFGWKLHLLVDCESELPVAAQVSAGNVHDSKRATWLLSEARHTHTRIGIRYVIGDMGYSGRKLARNIRQHYHAAPIIQTNPAHKKLMAKNRAIEATPGWKALYRQRTAVERVNSRLKGQHALNSIRVRRRWRVTAHCYLALIALQTRRADRIVTQRSYL